MIDRVRSMFTGLLLTGLLAGCAAVPEDYAGTRPEFRIEEFFAGHVTGYGMVQSRSGKVTQRLTVDIYGSATDEGFRLREFFVYHDGRREYREWLITPVGPHRYEGRTEAVVGVAQGYQYGHALNLDYVMQVPVDGETYALRFDDWMYRHSERIVLNRASFSKFGVELGSVTLTFVKQDGAAQPPDVTAFLDAAAENR